MPTSNDLNISQSGYVAFDGLATFTGRTFQAGTGVTITNGDGVSGNTVIGLTGGGIAIDSLTPDSGTTPVVPDGAGNVTLQGTGSITTVGGTNSLTPQLTGLTNHTVLVGAGTATITKVGPGSAGQVLQSGGASADPAYSTATYPSTATGTGTILRANGTNWVATTATYPATAGTSGNVLTSDGTNFVSSAPPFFQTANITLTNTQIKNLHATPITAIPAPAAGQTIEIISTTSRLNYGGNNAFVAGGGATIIAIYSNLAQQAASSVGGNAQLIATANSYQNGSISIKANIAATNCEGLSMVLYNPSATEISDNAANDNTMTFTILYYITSF